MGIWGAGTATAGALNAGASVANTILNYQHAKKLQNHQYDLNRKALREFYANTRHSLVSAGFNPLLATQQGAQGFSASSSGTPSTLGEGVGEAINSAISLRQANEQVKKTKAETEGVELENKLKKKELDTSPKSVISDLIRGEENPVVDFVKNVGNKLGINTHSATSSIKNQRRDVPIIKLHDGKGYVQRGVPKSIVKQFDKLQNSAVSSKRFREMSDDEIRRYKPSKKRYNSPPREYPR